MNLQRVFLASLLFLLTHFSYAQRLPQRVTMLRVREFTFGEETQFLVTSDSIKIKVSKLLEAGTTDTAFALQLSSQQRDWLLSSFDQTYLSAVQPEYIRSTGSGHYPHFYIGIHKGDQIKVTTIYRRKVAFFSVFCQRINAILPAGYHISYTDGNYFKG